jgi:hypothetical protein
VAPARVRRPPSPSALHPLAPGTVRPKPSPGIAARASCRPAGASGKPMVWTHDRGGNRPPAASVGSGNGQGIGSRSGASPVGFTRPGIASRPPARSPGQLEAVNLEAFTRPAARSVCRPPRLAILPVGNLEAGRLEADDRDRLEASAGNLEAVPAGVSGRLARRQPFALVAWPRVTTSRPILPPVGRPGTMRQPPPFGRWPLALGRWRIGEARPLS